MIKVIVISLKYSKRRSVIAQRLKEHNIHNFEFYDAFDARHMELSELSNMFDVNKFEEIYGRLPARGEVGCTISHIDVWGKIANSETNNWIIFEDDAILEKGFGKVLKDFPNGFNTLGFSKTSKLKAFLMFWKFKLSNKTKYKGFLTCKMETHAFRGLVGYTIQKDVAKTLHDNLKDNPCFMTDDFNYLADFVEIKTSKPAFVFEDYNNLESSIESERKINSSNKGS